jgi:two-component system, chemotaxis family, CheB/CheR fusion protein
VGKVRLLDSPARKKKSSEKDGSKELSPKPFPIVGFGASAGGLEAFTKLLQHLDSNLGMAYVLIMHLSPNHKSSLAEIVQSKTKMPVHTVTDDMAVMRNNIYVIPPNTFMSLVDGHLKLAPRSLNVIGNFAVDYFLTALASAYKNNAIGVILSGTATDGTLGLKAIKAEGGITFAQDETAKFSGMPRNAYDSGYVDFLLPPEGIAEELARLVNVPYTKLPSDEIESVQKEELNGHAEELKKILAIVKNKFGIDFFLNYKHASVYRRVVRRMVLNKFVNLPDYTAMLKSSPKEVDALYDDFLINVTSFFRDPDFYKLLTTAVFPALIKERKPADPIRIWVAGCSTGEEAYSITICLLEFLEESVLSLPIQIFASDLDTSAIERARLGIYPMSSLQGVSASHLKKYFVKIDGHYQIIKSVRELCIFSQQNLLKDPPFSRLDLISCQNVLIYLETNPQTRILQTFHYALKSTGYLFLGKSESVGATADLFEQLDKKIKVFSRKSTKSPQLEFTIHTADNQSFNDRQITEQKVDVDAEKDIGKLILSRYVPPCIVVNKNLMIVQFFGLISPYLEPVTGKASLNVLKIIRADLVVYLGSLLQKARKTEKVAIKEDIVTEFNKEFKGITIEVAPIKNVGGDIAFLVVFKEHSIIQPPVEDRSTKSKSRSDSKESTITKLEEQLTESRGLIRASNEEYETTYEELQAYNEEILSSNEELQSVNEELETSKEELQSAIEELSTTNEELRKRNIDLKQSQTYAEAIVETVHSPLLVLTANLQVRMANKAFYRTFVLIPEKTEGQFIYELGDNSWEIPSLREHLSELLAKKSNFKDFELRHFFPGLGELVLDVNAYRLMKDDNSNETLLLLAFNNISELLRANRELKKVNEQLAEFAFVSSHDLQEPLRKIQHFASYLAQPEANLNDFAKNYSKKINASSSRMSTLIRDLLSFSLLSQADKKLLTVDLNETLKHVIEDFEGTIEIKKAIVNVGPLPSVHAEPVHMSQLFSNLIGNALKFGKENPVINITSEKVSIDQVAKYELNRDKQYIAIIISDNGMGFDQKYATKMFTLFQRLDNIKGMEGSGVGLAICKRIVEDHGGVILANGKENEGATFTVVLPV